MIKSPRVQLTRLRIAGAMFAAVVVAGIGATGAIVTDPAHAAGGGDGAIAAQNSKPSATVPGDTSPASTTPASTTPASTTPSDNTTGNEEQRGTELPDEPSQPSATPRDAAAGPSAAAPAAEPARRTTLPATGADAWPLIAIGVGLLTSGLGLRLLVR
jgi:hypothetical protein